VEAHCVQQQGDCLTDDELLSLIDTYAGQSYGWDKGQLSTERALAIARYNSEPYGDEQEGRSKLVSSEIRDTVETVIPQLQRIFLSGDNICEFDPETPDDVGRAKQESRYVNWVIQQRNSAYQVFGTWFRDALLCKNGYVKAWWEERSDVSLESYQGLSDEQLMMVQQDEAVQITALTSYPAQGMPQPAPLPQAMGQAGQIQPPAPMLHDIQVRRMKTRGFVRVDNVPCEEMLVHQSTRGLDLQDALYVEHRTSKTLSEIRQMGYDVEDHEAGTLDESASMIEPQARDRFNEIQTFLTQESSDPAARVATFREVWVRVDQDGDGVAELRKLCLINRRILANDETDIVPVACITPVIQPHRHVGYGYYDFLKDIESARTAMIRAYFDNLYLANNGRMAVNVEKVNLDDLLVSRPGGIIRVDGDPTQNIMPVTHPVMGDAALSGMNFLDTWKKNATGVMADSQTLSADVLNNSTATGISQAISVWQARVEGVARCFAETGITDIFRIIHALTLKHATGEEKFQIGGEWIAVDPREWVKRTSLTVTVGLGTGSKETKMAFLQQLAMMQQQGLQIGIAQPQNIYETAMELVKEMGYKDGERFWTDPRKSPPPPPQKDPMVQAQEIKTQGELQQSNMKHQSEAQQFQAELQAKPQEAMLELQKAERLAEIEAQAKIAIAEATARSRPGRHRDRSDPGWRAEGDGSVFCRGIRARGEEAGDGG
jgi:hypothetical protein